MDRIPGKILVVDDDPDVLVTAKLLLKRRFSDVLTEKDPTNLYKQLANNQFDVVLLDMNFSPGATSGREGLHWLKEILRKAPESQVVLNTAYGDVELAVKAMKEGAMDFVVKPWDEEKLIATIQAALKLSQSQQEVNRLRTKHKTLSRDMDQQYSEMISESPAMQPVFDTIEKVAVTDANVLILGENGTGKELVARAIHRSSKRNNEDFVKVDLGAIPESLFESELFGHVKGAFTDAKEDKPGRFEIASGGTLFLDEIGNVPLQLQAKLLSALQNRTITRVGSTKSIPIDIRLVSATNMPLYEMTEEGTFRQDLLYRINTVEILIPPLRERPEDINAISKHYLNTYVEKYNKCCYSFTNDALDKMLAYSWPGNIRELQHAVERAVIMSDGDELDAPDILMKSQTATASSVGSPVKVQPTLNVEELEKQAIQTAIRKHSGNLSKAAKELGMGRNTLYRKLEKYGL